MFQIRFFFLPLCCIMGKLPQSKSFAGAKQDDLPNPHGEKQDD
jgi:hypothetical protein